MHSYYKQINWPLSSYMCVDFSLSAIPPHSQCSHSLASLFTHHSSLSLLPCTLILTPYHSPLTLHPSLLTLIPHSHPSLSPHSSPPLLTLTFTPLLTSTPHPHFHPTPHLHSSPSLLTSTPHPHSSPSPVPAVREIWPRPTGTEHQHISATHQHLTSPTEITANCGPCTHTHWPTTPAS